MEDDLRRRQIEEEMARFEQEIFQVQQTLQPPPAPPAVMFIPPQMHRPIRPPPIPAMMMQCPRPHLSGPPMSMGHSNHSPSISAPPVKVYSAPPKKAKDVEHDEIMNALKRAEAELKEAKKNKIATPEQVVVPPQKTSATSPIPAATSQPTPTTPVAREEKKPKKLIRMGGQQVWEDNSLAEWDPDDFRIFCGDLGNDVTDEMLTRVFSKYPTFVKAKVIRDKRTNKSKGYGFVSFKEPQGFIKAMRELNGKYVGSRPIKLRKSTWNERNMDVVKKKMKEKQRLGLL